MGAPYLWGLMSVVTILTLPPVVPVAPVVYATCEDLTSLIIGTIKRGFVCVEEG